MAVRLALDTNRYTDPCRGNAKVVETVDGADEVWLPFIALGELRAGFAVIARDHTTKRFCGGSF